MTSHPDSTGRCGDDVGATSAGARATKRGEGDRLRQQVRDREVAQRLDRRLSGYGLPDVELQSLHATHVPLLRHISGRVVVEFFPGAWTRPVTHDGGAEQAPMQARHEHADSLQDLGSLQARTISVISDPPTAVDLTTAFIDPHGLLFCDPELLIGDALGLPSVQKDDVRRYRRLTLVTKDGRIAKVIFPPDENFDSHVRRIVSWMRAARW